MTLEAPIQIDLSDDASWDKIDSSLLSNSEKELLAKQFSEESKGIIYLTKEELESFKTMLSSETPETYASQLQEFAKEQIAEGLSTSDLLGESFEGIDSFSNIDELSHEGLFGDEGIFKALNISSIAQDSMSVALSLSIIENISENDISTGGGILTEIASLMQDKLGVLKTLSEKHLILGQSSTMLQISGNGENNSIFMNAEQGKAFFLSVFSGKLDEASMKSTLEGANTKEVSQGDLAKLGNLARKDIADIIEKIKTPSEKVNDDPTKAPVILDVPGAEKIDPKIPSTLEVKEDDNFIVKFIKQLLAGIKKMMGSIVDASAKPKVKTDKPDTSTEIAPTNIKLGRDLFRTKLMQGNISPFTIAQVQKLFPEKGELTETAKSIIKAIQDIGGDVSDEAFAREFNNLFVSGKGFSKFKNFMDESNGSIVEDTKSPGENMLALITKYKEYRIAYSAKNSLTFKKFFKDSKDSSE